MGERVAGAQTSARWRTTSRRAGGSVRTARWHLNRVRVGRQQPKLQFVPSVLVNGEPRMVWRLRLRCSVASGEQNLSAG
jgi:hypothetical protein